MSNFIYKFVDNKDNILYIGKTISLIQRLTYQHFTSSGHLPEQCYTETKKIYYTELDNQDETSIYERYLINIHNPKYNSQYKNNSTFRFTLPQLKWVEFNKDKNTQRHIRQVGKNGGYIMSKGVQYNKSIEEYLRKLRIEFQREKEEKLNDTVKYLKTKRKINIDELAELVQSYILSGRRFVHFRNLVKYLKEQGLYDSIDVSLNENLRNNKNAIESFAKCGMVINKEWFRIRGATPQEFYEKLIELSRLINDSYVHKKWMSEFMYACDLDFSINRKEQTQFLNEKGVDVKTYFIINETPVSDHTKVRIEQGDNVA